MADTLTTLSLVTLAQEFRGDVVRNVNRKTVAARVLPLRAGAGKNIAWAPEYSGALAENYSEGADATNFASDTQSSAILPWGLQRAAFHVSQLAMDGAATTLTPAGNNALWARNLVNASAALASKINADIYTGSGAGLIIGLETAIGSNNNTYATIDRSNAANALFRPYVVDPGVLTAPTFAQIRTDIAAIYKASGMRPDIALVSPNVFNSVVALFDSTRRFIQDINRPGGAVRLESAAAAVEVDGVVFIMDKDAVESTIYYLNMDHVYLEYLPGAAERALMAARVQVEATDGFGMFPLGFDYHMLAKTGPSEKAEVVSTMQLVCDRPNTCGVRRNVAI